MGARSVPRGKYCRSIFICSTLPGTLRIAEVNLHIRRDRKLFVFGHLQSTVPGQGEA